MEICDYRGYRIGHVLRYYPELSPRSPLRGPKAISYWENRRVPLLHFEWHSEEESDSWVVVEDIVSAKRVAKYKNCIALLGTHLNDDSVSFLIDMGIKNIYIALDQDAWSVAYKLKEKYSLFFRNFSVITWSNTRKDPKDQTEEQLKAWLLA